MLNKDFPRIEMLECYAALLPATTNLRRCNTTYINKD